MTRRCWLCCCWGCTSALWLTHWFNCLCALARVPSSPHITDSLRPPAAFKTIKSLSAASPGHILLLEYIEERPLMLLQPGMGVRLTTYYRRKNDNDMHYQALQAEYSEGLTARQVSSAQPSGTRKGAWHAVREMSSMCSRSYKAPFYAFCKANNRHAAAAATENRSFAFHMGHASTIAVLC